MVILCFGIVESTQSNAQIHGTRAVAGGHTRIRVKPANGNGKQATVAHDVLELDRFVP
jgi:hypothetical protein